MASTSVRLGQSLRHCLVAVDNASSVAAVAAAASRRGGSATMPFSRMITSLLRQEQGNVIVRAQSTWGGYTSGGGGGPRRPIVNGRSVAFHIKDIQNGTGGHNSNNIRKAVNGHSRKTNGYTSDLVVILDMDECLIHSQFLDGPGAKFAHQVRRNNKVNHAWPTPAVKQDPVDTFQITLPDGENVLVHERPHLRKFLQTVSAKYETHVFTAAMEVYAKPVLDILDSKGTIFSKIWYREHCVLDRNMGAYVKNLDFQWGGDKLKRTVLVDNNPLSFLSHPSNGILVSSFYDDPSDETLPAVMELLDELDDKPDVRPILESRFGLEQALNDLREGGQGAGLRKSSSLATAHAAQPPQQQAGVATN